MSARRSRSRSRAMAAAGALIGLAVLPAGCGDDKEPSVVETDEMYLSVIEWQVERMHDGTSAEAPPTTKEGDLPVIYVAAADGSKIDASVQATVAHAMVDIVTVRFADSRDEALDLDNEAQPVLDGGVLLSIGPVDVEPARQRTAEVDVYRSLTEESAWVLTIRASIDGARVTSSTLQPE